MKKFKKSLTGLAFVAIGALAVSTQAANIGRQTITDEGISVVSSASRNLNNTSGSTTRRSTTKTANNTQTTIGAQKAKEIALAHANLQATEVTFTKAQLDTDDGVKVYEVKFLKGTTAYEYEIDALSGKIREWSKGEKNTGVTQKNTTTQTAPTTSTTQTTTTTQTTQTIGAQKAKEIALAHAGLAASDVVFKKAKLDFEDGVKVYEVEFKYQYQEYEYEIHATTGKILKFEID
jgi:uncharacterized membrane protein YkoI